MSCSFNRTLWFATADAIGTEARAYFNVGELKGLTFFAPQINMAANPLWGRNMECPGEDPHLSSEFAFQYVTGLQGGEDGILKAVAVRAGHAGPPQPAAVARLLRFSSAVV